MMQRKIQQYLLRSVISLAIAAPATYAETYLYRYENDKGVKVLNHTIPPQYAQKSYEILSTAGQLIRTVEAAPTDGAVAKENSVRMLREKYAILKRRYSSPEDIEAAKRRRLANINTNIAILRGNIGGINIRIDNLRSKAADSERAGREVSSSLLTQLRDIKAELTVSEDALNLRLEEYQAVSDRYDGDLTTFALGSALSSNGNFN